jgi:hypothetical protein
MEYEEKLDYIFTPTLLNHNQNPTTTTPGMVGKYVVNKLAANNCKLWKTRVELIMEHNNLTEIVDGSRKMPQDKPDKSMCKSMDLGARIEIIMHPSDEQVDYVCMHKIHQPSDEMTKFIAFRAFMNLQMNEGKQIEHVISK